LAACIPNYLTYLGEVLTEQSNRNLISEQNKALAAKLIIKDLHLSVVTSSFH
jgi:hypothetical protein